MVHTLRRRHLFIWILWAILIPLGLVAAFSVVEEQKIPFEQQTLYSSPNYSTETPIAGNVGRDISWSLWKGEDSTQLRVFAEIHTPLTHPAAFVYVVPTLEAPLSSADVVGKLGPVGTYEFTFNKDWLSDQGVCFVVHDPIKSQTIHTVEIIP